jgi:glyoxylase-like metal-dependent hydrolase (beta-lactamase superfamily II)
MDLPGHPLILDKGLAPMFHRFRIGEIEATILSDGPLYLPCPAEAFSGPARAALDDALGGPGRSGEAIRVEQNCLLIENAGKRVLFDNGMGTAKLYGPASGQLLAGLAEAGIGPASIDALVLTHAHSDHCWGTMRDDGVPNYPNAAIYMAEAELAYWESNPPGERRDVSGVRKHLLPLRERIVVIRDGQEFLPGVHAWATPGHTPGHMAYLLSGGWCLIGDVAFHDPLSYAFTEAASIFDTDPVQAAATRHAVLARLAEERLSVVGYHNPWPGLGRVERFSTAFRFRCI